MEHKIRKAVELANELAKTAEECCRREAFLAVFHSMMDRESEFTDDGLACVIREGLGCIAEAIIHSRQDGDAGELAALVAKLKATTDKTQAAVNAAQPEL